MNGRPLNTLGRPDAKGEILIVDDNPSHIRFLERLLTENGYTVRPAVNGSMALKSVQSFTPDIILLDTRMPEMDGFEVCRQLKSDEAIRDIPVIFMGLPNGSGVEGMAPDTEIDYITKPLRRGEVLTRVNTHIRFRNMRKRLERQNIRLKQEIAERGRAEDALKQAHDELELRVRRRTSELADVIEDLHSEIAGRKDVEAALRKTIYRSQDLEAQLHQAQKMDAIGTLAGGIAHDFNNILTAVLGYAQMAKGKIESNNPDVTDEIDCIFQAGIRAKDLVEQILKFSRQTGAVFQPLNLNQVIEEAVKLLKATLPATIEIKKQIKAIKEKIMADQVQIHQIIMNLCTNAAHAMRANGGVMSVSLERHHLPEPFICSGSELGPGDYVVLTVKDTGEGMAPDVLRYIFDPYFTTKEKGEGTGLGLAVTLGIIKNHKGSMTVDSTVGEGSEFSVYFPIFSVGPTEPVLIENPIVTGTERILFLDDEEFFMDLASRMLSDLGYDVTVTTDSENALNLILEKPDQFDLLITDQLMPKLTGLDLVRRLRAKRIDLPVVICTGFSDNIDAKKAEKYGVTQILHKPVIKWDYAVAIRKALDG